MLADLLPKSGHRPSTVRVAKLMATWQLSRIRVGMASPVARWVNWDATAWARVITGGALNLVLHPFEDRTLTHRECARIMGFPDNWRILPNRRSSGLSLWWGKGISTQCGKWIGEQVQRAIEGHPGSITGQEIGEREYLIKPPR